MGQDGEKETASDGEKRRKGRKERDLRERERSERKREI